MSQNIRSSVNKMRKFLRNKKAVGAGAVVSIAVGLLICAYLFPIGINAIMDSNTSVWDTAVTTIFTVVLPILATVGVALKFIPSAKK